jgi:hypothetical protein
MRLLPQKGKVISESARTLTNDGIFGRIVASSPLERGQK